MTLHGAEVLAEFASYPATSVFNVHSTAFLQVISCVDHTCRSVALASFWLYNVFHVLLSSKLSGVRTSRTLKRTCIIRLLFLLIHRKGTVYKDISKACVVPISAQELDHISRSLKNGKC